MRFNFAISAISTSLITIRSLMTGLAVLSVALIIGGCASGPRTYSIPQQIKFDTATGVWSVKTEGSGGVEQLRIRLA